VSEGGHHEGALRGRALAAFVVVTLIWGSTWLVIRDQIAVVPPAWTVTWRFMLAAAGMFTLAMLRGEGLRLGPGGARLAVAVGLTQFFANFQLVYRAEQHLTSGLVAAIYALMLVPNAVFARVFLGARVTGRFVAGSAVAIAGIGVLLWQEWRGSGPLGAPGLGDVVMGVALAGVGVLCASAANVLQATRVGRAQQVVPMIAWAMLVGAIADAVFAYATSGAPVFDPRARYWLGVGYLGLVGSVVAFPLYFSLIRWMGPGRAAYNGVAVPVVAMGLSTVFEGYRWSGAAALGAGLAFAGLGLALSGRVRV
jgi:drug/metabolite transporter (DMT)-like permease